MYGQVKSAFGWPEGPGETPPPTKSPTSGRPAQSTATGGERGEEEEEEEVEPGESMAAVPLTHLGRYSNGREVYTQGESMRTQGERMRTQGERMRTQGESMRFGFAYYDEPILHSNVKEPFLDANVKDIPIVLLNETKGEGCMTVSESVSSLRLTL